MAEKGGATLWMLFRLERYQLDTQHEEKKKYYRIAEKKFPQEKDRKLLAILAESIRINGEEEPTKEEMWF